MIRRGFAVWSVLRRHRLYELIPAPMQRWWLRLLLSPMLPRRDDHTSSARLRIALQTLGPVFIKFGQLLSTRRDLLPEDLADELAQLQDRVPPFPSNQAVSAIEQALGAPLDALFASFDPEPLAAASVAQVHGATLPSGEAVVVKVLHMKLVQVVLV